MQRHLYPNSTIILEIKDQLSIQIGWNAREYSLNVIFIGLMENKVYLLCPSLLLSILTLTSRVKGGGEAYKIWLLKEGLLESGA